MKFAVGYPLPLPDRRDPAFAPLLEYREHLSELYFAWPGVAGGRAPLPRDLLPQLLADLHAARDAGLRLNLLFNASCYGPRAFSRSHAADVAAIIDQARDQFDIDIVTTMSPLLAQLVKQRYGGRMAVRASVNMRLGSLRAMQQLGDLFDGFVVQRDLNRNLPRLAEIRRWADAAGKHLQLLANSGCLSFCAVQTFHDNLVSHEAEIDAADCAGEIIPGGCWQHYARRENWSDFLRNTWIRPEDVHHYEGLVSEMKLATRMHASAARVVRAYCNGRFSGNLADLLEPGHARLFAPWVFDNRRFPPDWFQRITALAVDPSDPAAHDAERDYCRQVLDQVLVNTTPG